MNAIEKIDKNFATAKVLPQDELVFHDVRKEPFTIHGLLYDQEDGPFRRIPQHIAEKVNEGTLRLHTNTAGGRVRFCTDSSRIAIRAVMPKKCLMPHMPFLGSSGFDLYEQTDVGYQYRGSFTPPTNRGNEYESVIPLGSGKMRAFTIHFPLYDNVAQLYIGLDTDAQIATCKGYTNDIPIFFTVPPSPREAAPPGLETLIPTFSPAIWILTIGIWAFPATAAGNWLWRITLRSNPCGCSSMTMTTMHPIQTIWPEPMRRFFSEFGKRTQICPSFSPAEPIRPRQSKLRRTPECAGRSLFKPISMRKNVEIAM